MAKDPACLFYISTWLTATAEMDADVRGWYLNLILHQYDKNDLPDDIDTLASLAAVKPKEYQRFNHVFEHVLKQRFKQNDNGRLENDFAKEILQSRQQFKEQRSKSGSVGYCMKIAYQVKEFKAEFLAWLKIHLYSLSIEELESSKSEHVLKQKHELYKDIVKNKNKDKDIILLKEEGEVSKIEYNPDILKIWNFWIENKSSKKFKNKKAESIGLKKFVQLCNGDPELGLEIVEQSISNCWQGLFPLKEINNISAKQDKRKLSDNITDSVGLKRLKNLEEKNNDTKQLI